MSYLLGIDVGTSSVKTVLLNEVGEVLAVASPEHDFFTPKPLWAESNPEDWWAAAIIGIKSVLEKAEINGNEVEGIGLTGQMHGLVLLDRGGKVLRPCIMWNDQRTGDQCQAITNRVGTERVIQLTGNPILPGFTAPKIVWVRENEPEVFTQIAKVLLPKDYIRFRLSGEFFTDVSDASGTSLLEVARRNWCEEMLESCGIPRDWMTEVTESPVVSSRVSREASALTGLSEGTPIVAGGGDQAAQAVGCGIVSEGKVSATLGTSGVVFAHSDEYRVDPQGRLHAFCHAVPGKYHLMGVMLSAAGSLQWFRNTLCRSEMEKEAQTGTDAYDLLTREASEISPGAEGLIFLPYLSGERTPHPDPHARGVFFGLTLRHTRAHMTRAVLEGITFGLRDSLELMCDLGSRPQQIVASGGGAKSIFWQQLMADIFETPIQVVNATEGAAFGAALLAGVGTGVFPTVEEACEKAIRVTDEVAPGENAGKYSEAYALYRSLYPMLKDSFEIVAQAH